MKTDIELEAEMEAKLHQPVRPSWVPAVATFFGSAKYPGKCNHCGGKIAVGESIWWVAGHGVYHPSEVECSESKAAKKSKPFEGVEIARFRDVEELLAHFETAGKKLKFPTLSIPTKLGTLVITVATSQSTTPGGLILRLKGAYGKKYLGWIDKDGSVYVGPSANRTNLLELMPLIGVLVADTKTAIHQIGRQSGYCCYCDSQLTDPPSLLAGFGPVCAKNWGLKDVWDACKKKAKGTGETVAKHQNLKEALGFSVDDEEGFSVVTGPEEAS